MNRFDELTVRKLIADFSRKVPPELTLAVGFDQLIDVTVELSDQMTQDQFSRTVGALSIIAKYAAHEEFSGTPIKIKDEARQ